MVGSITIASGSPMLALFGAAHVGGRTRVEPTLRTSSVRRDRTPTDATAKAGNDTDRPKAATTSSGARQLSSEELRQLEGLKKRDREVRAHENAHRVAAGNYAGPAQYVYTAGPDGQRYAVSGEVPIDLSPIPGDPAATAQKMEQVERAALAPANPSTADRQIAATAERLAAEAAREQRATKDDGEASSSASDETSTAERVERRGRALRSSAHAVREYERHAMAASGGRRGQAPTGGLRFSV